MEFRGYTIDQAAQRLTVCRRTLQRQIEAGAIRAHRIGRRVVIPESELCRLLGHVEGRVDDSPRTKVRKR